MIHLKIASLLILYNAANTDNEFAVLARDYNGIAAIHYNYYNYSKFLESLFKAL